MKKHLLAIAALFATWSALSGQTITLSGELQWAEEPTAFFDGNASVDYWSFDEAVAGSAVPGLPYVVRRFKVDGPGKLRVEVVRAEYEPFDWENPPQDGGLGSNLTFEASINRQREGYYGKIAFAPIVRRGGRYERLSAFELRVRRLPGGETVTQRGPTNTETSALADGDIYKVAITETGMQKLTYGYLKDELGIDIDNIDPGQIKVYGNTGGLVPYYTEAPREDDLVENYAYVEDGGDGAFDPGDYLLFYAQGAEAWSYDAVRDEFNQTRNIYDTRNYHFIKISPAPAQRIATRGTLSNTAYTTGSFDDYIRLEEERFNLLHEWSKAQGSAQHWYGEQFKVTRSHDYNEAFRFPNLIGDEGVKVRARFAGRARVSSYFYIDIYGQTVKSDKIDSVNSINGPADNIRRYADAGRLSGSVLLSDNDETIPVTVRYPHPQGPGDESEGWIDWVQLRVRRQLAMSGEQLAFRDLRTLGYPSATFELDNASGLVVWDITNPLQPVQQEVVYEGSRLSFGANTGELREFVAFDPSAALHRPEPAGPVGNQNLHGLSDVDMVIVYPPELEGAALRLAEHRAAHNGIRVEAVEAGKVYNEFASGRQEPTAIRDFARMLYDRSEGFQYLLLLGDGSFDNRDLYGLGGNFLPTYQEEDFNPVETYPTDDFYAILYGNSPSAPLNGELQIAVGRLPVKNMQEAEAVVDKIIRYDADERALGDWRNRLVFVGDDNDGAGDLDHYKQADDIAGDVQADNQAFNIEKIYLDAFPQESTPGGERVPQATERINQSVFKGALAITYLGHGGPKGWAQERVLNLSDIFSWDNNYRMPIFLTATCSFAGYDDPTFVTAGEEVLLNSNGGSAGLLTTVRAVYSNANKRLTDKALSYLLRKDEQGQPLTLGMAFRNGKNDLAGNFNIDNSRKFALLGDPAMPVALPQYEVRTTAVGETVGTTEEPDTLRALQQVTVRGEVVDANGNRVEGFNGIIYPSVFDKVQQVSTLGQGANSVYQYDIQQNIIFKGRASVANGRFEFSFVVPKDINYELGYGKISYYAADEGQMLDGAGSYGNFIIGGTDPGAVADNQGPQVEVYMNTQDFVFGSAVNPAPTLLVRLSDDNGINVVGNSIGHDLEGILNDDTQNTYLLNDFYESDLDNYTSGEVRYPMKDLAEGRHHIRVKAWDVANNSSEGYTEFVVAESGEVALQQVLNYPNPFTDRTCFQFDHNLANQDIEVLVQIYTVSGRLVKTLQTVMFSDGALRQDDCIEWDGRDDFGGRLARGVYLYKVKVRAANTGTSDLSGESGFEKLVILK